MTEYCLSVLNINIFLQYKMCLWLAECRVRALHSWIKLLAAAAYTTNCLEREGGGDWKIEVIDKLPLLFLHIPKFREKPRQMLSLCYELPQFSSGAFKSPTLPQRCRAKSFPFSDRGSSDRTEQVNQCKVQ